MDTKAPLGMRSLHGSIMTFFPLKHILKKASREHWTMVPGHLECNCFVLTTYTINLNK